MSWHYQCGNCHRTFTHLKQGYMCPHCGAGYKRVYDKTNEKWGDWLEPEKPVPLGAKVFGCLVGAVVLAAIGVSLLSMFAWVGRGFR
jgi:DNA-directed RNA polymerase subunit RPC12/RpoP